MKTKCNCHTKAGLFGDGDTVMICAHIFEHEGMPWRDCTARRFRTFQTFTRDDDSKFTAHGEIYCPECASKPNRVDMIETIWKNGAYWVADYVRAGLVTIP